MTIIHIIGTLNVGGIQKYLLQLFQTSSLEKLDHQIVCTISSNGKLRNEYVRNNIKINYLPFSYSPRTFFPYRVDKFFRYLISMLFIFRIWYFFLRSKADIIHSHIHKFIISQILASILSGKRIIWTIHGEYKFNKGTIYIIKFLAYLFSYNKFHIIGDSREVIEYTLPLLINNKNCVRIIPTGINIRSFYYKYDKSSIRKQYKIQKNCKLIGSTGRIVWEKGYDQLITLFQTYDFNDQRLHILIAGEGGLKNEYIQQIKKNGLEDKISFIGNIMNIPEFLNCLDIYIQPSLSEGFPLSVLESMAAGLPIICSDAGGLKSMITDGKNGILYKAGEIEDLYKAINKILNSTKNKLAQLGSAAKKTVINNYSIDTAAKEYFGLYKNV